MKKAKLPTDIPAALNSVDIKAILRKRGIYVIQKENQRLKELALPLVVKIKNGKKTKSEATQAPRHTQFSNEQVQAYWEKQIHIVEVLEARFEKKVEQFVDKMVDGYLKHLESEIQNTKRFKNISKDFFEDNEDELLVRGQLDFTPLLVDQAVLAGQEAYRLIGSKDIYTPEKLRAKISENVTKFTQSMIDTDRDTLINIISQSIQDGRSVPEIRNLIQADFDDISKNQAQRITRTEVLRVSNQASIDAYEQSGIVEAKQWLTAGAADECAQYEGQIVTLSNSFYGSDSEFQDGDPPLHPNCRCVVLPVLVETKAYEVPVNQKLYERIAELESQFDKRTKEYKEIKELKADDAAYIKALEQHLGVSDGQE